MTTNFDPVFILDSFCEWVSDWCQENSVQYQDYVVLTFLPWLNNENFMFRYQACCECLRSGDY